MASQGTAYPLNVRRTHLAADAIDLTDDDPPSEVTVAGRVIALRRMGKTSFLVLRDGSGDVQLFLNQTSMGRPAYQNMLDVLDVGDFVSANGDMFRTRTQEPSVRVKQLTVAAKALRPLPDKWHGLQDNETRFRQRYLDILSNQDVRTRFEARSAIVTEIRNVLDVQKFLEVETPTLQPVYGGGSAVPFVTSYAALDQDYYLRIADELYLKRLLVAGYERVYEICKNFRNEGIDGTHSPEFTMLEAYQAFADLSTMRELMEKLVVAAVETIHGSSVAHFKEYTIDFTPPWRRVTYRDALLEHAGIDIETSTGTSELLATAERNDVQVDSEWTRAKLMDELMKHLVEPELLKPTFVERYPVETTPLAKRCQDDPRYAERFEPFVQGMEIGNAYAELNDPLDQRARMEAHAAAQDNLEEMPVDEDFLLALEHGMPPAGGLGLGIDRLVMIVTGATNIREVIFFPQLRESP